MIAALDMVELGGWGALLAGMVLSFLYSGLETGTYAVNKIRLDLRAESGSRRASRLRAMQRHPGRALIVLLVGNNFANYLASAGLLLVLTRRQWAHADGYSVAILTPLIFIFCELLPKNLFHRHSETLTYAFSGFLEFSRRAFTAVGIVGLIRALVWSVMRLAGRRIGPQDSPLLRGQHISSILAEGRASGALTHAQSVIAERVVNIGRVRLSDVMVPLQQAVLLPETVSAEQLREVLRAHGHPRVGIYSGRRDNVVGVLNVYDVLLDESGSPAAAHVRPALTLPEEMRITEALLELQRRRNVIALVVSAEGGCVGLVSVKDLVEEIVGELEEW